MTDNIPIGGQALQVMDSDPVLWDAMTNCEGSLIGLENILMDNNEKLRICTLDEAREILQCPRPNEFVSFTADFGGKHAHCWMLRYENGQWLLYQSFQGHFQLKRCTLSTNIQRYITLLENAYEDGGELWKVMSVHNILKHRRIQKYIIRTTRPVSYSNTVSTALQNIACSVVVLGLFVWTYKSMHSNLHKAAVL